MNVGFAVDILGQHVEAGDRVVVAFNHDRSPELRIGRVVGFREVKDSEYTHKNYKRQMTIRWEITPENKTKWGAPTSKEETSIYMDLGRFLKLGDDMPSSGNWREYAAAVSRRYPEEKWGKSDRNARSDKLDDVKAYLERLGPDGAQTHEHRWGGGEPYTVERRSWIEYRDITDGIPGDWAKLVE